MSKTIKKIKDDGITQFKYAKKSKKAIHLSKRNAKVAEISCHKAQTRGHPIMK